MRVEYDAVADAAYIYLVDDIGAGGVTKTVPCDPHVAGLINLDFDRHGRLLGIEVLDARRILPAELIAADGFGPPDGGATLDVS